MDARRKTVQRGPIATSCFTCRRRRKKCDKIRPACERCMVGGFVCQGYPHLGEGATTRGLGTDSYDKHPSFFGSPSNPDFTAPTGSPDLSSLLWSSLLNSPSSCYLCGSTGVPHLDTTYGSNFLLLRHPHSPSPLDQTLMPDSLSTLEIGHHESHSYNPTIPMMDTQVAPESIFSPHLPSIPRGLPPISKNLGHIGTYILDQFERLVRLSFFQPACFQFPLFHKFVVNRIHHPNATLWTKYLTCKIFESILDGTSQQKISAFNHSLHTIELYLNSTPTQHLTPTESHSRLTSTLEILFIKLRLSKETNSHQLLQGTVPAFLKLVSTDPNLWPDLTQITSVSLAHVLGSTKWELSHFVLLDALHSMAYVLPQVIDYDTSIPPLRSDTWPSKWVYGFPIQLQFALIDINGQCNDRAGAGRELDWQSIEHRIKSWEPPVEKLPDNESQSTIVTLAVQESWRHTLLIYLYMTLCRAKTDDARVKESVRQVFKLISSASAFSNPTLGTHFLAQYLIAGICARSEKHRSIARETLARTIRSGIYLLRTSDFVPVLDHLWRGAAANGQPIRWSDYAKSRQVVLPIFA